MDQQNLAGVNNLVVGLNSCFVDVLHDGDLVSQTKKLMDFATSADWIRTVEEGTRQDVVDALG